MVVSSEVSLRIAVTPLVKGGRDMGRGLGSLRVLSLFPNFEPSCLEFLHNRKDSNEYALQVGSDW